MATEVHCQQMEWFCSLCQQSNSTGGGDGHVSSEGGGGQGMYYVLGLE